MGCIEIVESAIREIVKGNLNTVAKDTPVGKEVKFDDSLITSKMVSDLFEGTKVKEASVDTIADLMGTMGTKVNGLRDMKFSNISKYTEAVKDVEKVVPYNIALKELFDTQKAETDKVNGTKGIESITKVSNDGVMNVALARSASVIGRKLMYTLGYRFKANVDGSKIDAIEVERMYNTIGRQVLHNMKNDGLVEITTGKVVNDYIAHGDTKSEYGEIDTDIARPKLEALLDSKDYEANSELYKALLRGEKVDISRNNPMTKITTMVNAINVAKVPPLMSKPLTSPATKEQQVVKDYTYSEKYEESYQADIALEARNILHENPTQLNETVIPYLKYMSDQWNNSNKSFPAFIKSISEDEDTMLTLFGVDPASNYTSDLENSIAGQNRSKLGPIQDLLENLNDFIDGNKSLDLYMNYNYVRNARLNMDNSILNGQSSKYMRHLVSSGTVRTDLNDPDQVVHTVGAILDQLGSIPDLELKKDQSDQYYYDILTGAEPNSKLDEQLNEYRKLVETEDGRRQSRVFTRIDSNGNIMETIDTLGAIYDLRKAVESDGIMVSRFNTKSDATASGGTITASTSTGYSQKAIAVMEQLGFTGKGDSSINDIYGLLENKLLGITKGVEDLESDTTKAELKMKDRLQEFLDVVYKGDMRDLSKDPTMTFVYNQGKIGAIQTIAETVTEKLLKDLKNKDTIAYITKVLELDTTPSYVELLNRDNLKLDLRKALSRDDGVIKFIHKQLEDAVKPIIEKRKEVILDLYKEASKLQKRIKIRPAIAAMDGGLPNTPEIRAKYGMPLSKIQNILHTDGKFDTVTMEEIENPTTALVNTTHGMDNAIASLAITRAVKRFKKLYPNDKVPGTTFVHDEIITSPKLGVLVDEEYIKAFPEVVAAYSVEQELLDLILQSDPKNKVALELQPIVDKANEVKKDIMKNFTSESGKVYGNKKGKFKVTIGKKPKPTPPDDGGKKVKPKEESTYEKDSDDLFKLLEPSADVNEDLPSAVNLDTLKDPYNYSEEFSTKFSDTLSKIRKSTSPKEVTELLSAFISTLKVSGVHNNLRDKIVNTLSREIMIHNQLPASAKLSNVWGGLSGKVYMDTRDNTYSDVKVHSPERLLEIVGHEIDHAINYDYILSNKDSELVTYLGSVVDLISDADTSGVFNESQELYERVDYIADDTLSRERRITEMVSIISNEPKVLDSLVRNGVINNTTSKKVLDYVKRLLNKAYKYVSDSDVALFKPDNLEHLMTALNELDSRSKAFNLKGKGSKPDNVAIPKFTPDPLPTNFDTDRNYTSKQATAPEVIMGRSVHMLNEAARNIITSNAEKLTEAGAKRLDKMLIASGFPMYADVRARVLKLYNTTPALRELAHFMKLTSFKGKELKNKLLSLMHNIREERNGREHREMTKIHNLTANMPKEAQEKLYDMVTKVPLHNFFINDTELNSSKDVVDEIMRLTKETSKGDIKVVNDTVDLIVDKTVKKYSIYNVGDKYDTNTEQGKRVEKLIALKSLQKANVLEDIMVLKDTNKELYNAMKDNSLSLVAMTSKLHNMTPKGKTVSHTLMRESFGNRKQFKVITAKDRRKYDYTELTGWKVIKEPKGREAGIVAKDILDETFIEGLVSDDIPSYDIDVPGYVVDDVSLQASNIIKVGDSYKMIMTDAEKDKAGLVRDMGSALVKSNANMIAVDDSQFVRNELMGQAVRSVITSNSDSGVIEDIVDRIDDKEIDHPWVLKLEDEVEFDSLPDTIRNEYKPIQQNVSTINGLDKNITHVRKDLRHWLVGGHSPSLFTNPKMQRLSKVTKELIAGAKIGMVILNPQKLALDSISNNAQLSMLGVPLTKIARYGGDILNEVDSFNKAKNSMFEAKLKYSADPSEANKKEYEKYQDLLKINELWTAYSNGFMNSLSSDILNNNVDTTEGLQADIHKALNYLLTDKEGNKNTLHKIIGESSRFGIDGTHVLKGIGEIASSFGTTADMSMKSYLDGVATRIRDIKNNDDMVNYLSQFTIAPNAETVKAGTWINDVMDMTMRETYRRHLIDVGVDPKQAISKSIAIMPDYKEPMPVGLKIVSDYAGSLFPSFWTRTFQPTSYVARNKLFGLGLEQQVQSMLGSHIETVFDAHLLNKLSNGTFIHTPWETIGVGSVLPTNLFNFGT